MIKKLLLAICCVLVGINLSAQTTAYIETFDLPSGADSVTTTGTPPWAVTTAYSVSPTQSYTNTISLASTNSFETNTFSTVGNTFVLLDFDHICKIEFFDAATIEVSNDGGVSWTQLTCPQYLGGGTFCASGNKFASNAYLLWDPANPAAVPQASWWQSETFDVSSFLANTAQAKIRFKLNDNNNNGSGGNYGWLVDNVKVTVSPSELFPPVITLNNPIWQGPTSSGGPYLVSADVTDASGIDTVMLIYSLNGAPDDTIGLINTGGSTYEDTIPSALLDDSICYRVYAEDASPAANSAVEPTTGCNLFHVVPAPPQIQLGNGTIQNTGTSYPAPYGHWFNGARHQMLITAAEMNAAGVAIPINFQSLAFDVTGVNGTSLTDFTIKMSNYSGSTITNWVTTGLTQVFYSPGYTETLGWNTHIFQAPFQWDGVSNILVEVCFNNWPNGFTNNAIVRQTAYPSTRTIYYRSDSDGNLCANNSAFVTPSNNRPNMRFDLGLPQPVDFGTLSIDAPLSGGCNLTAAELVTAQFKNYGTADQDTLVFSYQMDANPIVTDTVYQNVPSGDTITHTFSQTVDLSVGGSTYTFNVWTSFPNDNNGFNDSIIGYSVTNTLTPGTGLSQDFDSWNAGGQVLADFWEQDNTDTYNWTVGTGPSPGFNTGPTADHTSGTGNYLFIANTFTSSTARLISPCLDFTGNTFPKMDFWYHMWGTGIGSLTVQYEDTTGAWVTAWSLTGDQGNSWQKAIVDLSPLANRIAKIRFVGQNVSFGGEAAIDDILIYQSAAKDAILDAILAPLPQLAAGATETVQIEFFNNGSDTIFTTNVGYIIGTSAPVIETWTGVLDPSTSTTYTFNTPFSVPGGTFDVCAFTDLLNDGQTSNDSLCTQSTGIQTFIPPYSDDFESGQGSWTTGGQTLLFELGTPTGNVINTASSPTNAWVTDLDAPYINNSQAYLFSPYFDFQELLNTSLKFKHWYSTENSWDGGRIDYSTDGGNTWSVLGAFQDSTWYNDDIITSSTLPGWTGASNTWVNAYYPLDLFNGIQGLVQFRFEYTSDGSVIGGDGWGIDDFEIVVPVQHSAATDNIVVSPSNFFILPQASPVSVDVQNTGEQDITSVLVTLEIDNTNIVTDSIHFGVPLQKGQFSTHTFSVPWQADPGQHTICVYTSNPNVRLDEYTPDDTTCYVATVFDSTSAFPYCNNFDGGQAPLVALNYSTYVPTGNNWESGVPSQTIINSAHSSPNAWMTGLSGDYNPRDSSALFSPVLNVNPDSCYKISFYHAYRTEPYQDGGIVEFSQDGGATWSSIGSVGTDWYNEWFIIGLANQSPGTAGFTGTSNGWEYAERTVQFPQAGTTIIRWRFGADFSVQNEGWAIDDICIENIGACTPTSIEEPNTSVVNVSIWPNPASDQSVIALELNANEEISWSLTNLLGEIVLSGTKPGIVGNNEIPMDLKEIASGVYNVSIHSGTVKTVRKLVITH